MEISKFWCSDCQAVLRKILRVHGYICDVCIFVSTAMYTICIQRLSAKYGVQSLLLICIFSLWNLVTKSDTYQTFGSIHL